MVAHCRTLSDRTEGFLLPMYMNKFIFNSTVYCKLSLPTEKCYLITFQEKVIKGYTKLKFKWWKSCCPRLPYRNADP